MSYPGHIRLNMFQRALLAVGSGIGAFFNPRRADFIATLGEATAPGFIERLKYQMLSSKDGRWLLRHKPRITSKSLNVEYLRTLPANTLGATYVAWLDREGVTPDTRLPVRFIDDPESAYAMQRYRESHDFYHAITGLPVFVEGEIALKAFEFANTGIPMTGLGALLAPLRLGERPRRRLRTIYFPWAIRNGLNAQPLINVIWENNLERDVNDLRRELGIEKPPDLRELRKRKTAHQLPIPPTESS
ncbi:hypothetical protein CANCADRAFT_148677 [Tortispora caseinolytica NRRL Y-17796]|uniref:4-hydroxy-3-methoxy-5-polyprenylbenzoate decarboxylase n=1 Tax=Tortispora caseinolytica NRRL Y-17796 TaxID=767744 RepID=A0A1E4T9H6_9ASCO|nr:hypothetical protein CANCADRAFT_148677 [Tortispora caseinolytica NRRL Y-17796]